MNEYTAQADAFSGSGSDVAPDGTRSRPDEADARQWSKWLATLLGVVAAVTAVLLAGIVFIDPFSTGRLTPITGLDIATRDAVLGHAARVRDPQYDSAVVGDSHAILFDPARLSAATGLHVVQLSAAAMGPREQLVIARAFVRNHPKAAALIVILDQLSCQATEKPIPSSIEFPAFLFEGSDIDYVRHLYFSDAVSAAVVRVLMKLRLVDVPRRQDGFDPWDFPLQKRAERLQRITAWPRPIDGPEPGTPIPALERLKALAAQLNPGAALLLYFSPKPFNTLPAPGTRAAEWLDFCKSRYRAIASERPHTVLVDRMVDDDFTSDIENFEDTEHLRNDLAPTLEREMIAAFRAITVDARQRNPEER